MFSFNLAEWKEKISLQAKLVLKHAEHANEDAAILMKEKVQEYTPVGDPSLWKYPAHKDYTPGFLKANWVYYVNGKEITISNDAPYAQRVEYGWSSQAPNGMLRRAILEFPQMLSKAAKENEI